MVNNTYKSKTSKTFTLDIEVYEAAKAKTANLSSLVNSLLRDYCFKGNKGNINPEEIKRELESKRGEVNALESSYIAFEDELAKMRERDKQIEEENIKKGEEIRARALVKQKATLKEYRPELDVESLTREEIIKLIGLEIEKERETKNKNPNNFLIKDEEETEESEE